MQLNELFDRPLPYKWDKSRSDDHHQTAVFTVDGREYSIGIDEFSDDPDEWEIGFSYPDTTRRHHTGITGVRGEVAVFSTVIAIIREFVGNFTPKSLTFSAKEPSRQRLYSRLISVLASEGWESEFDPKNKNFTLNRIGWGQ